MINILYNSQSLRISLPLAFTIKLKSIYVDFRRYADAILYLKTAVSIQYRY